MPRAMGDAVLETEGPGRPSHFLKALGLDAGSAQEAVLRQELECLAHPWARVAAARQEPVDTLVQFLASTRLAGTEPASTELVGTELVGTEPAGTAGPLQVFRARLAAETGRGPEHAGRDRSPRNAVLAAVPELFGETAATLAGRLEQLVEDCDRDGRPLRGATVSRLYREAEDLCRVWSLALDEELVHTGASGRTSASDELYATEGAVLGRFSSPCPPEERLELAELVRQTTELIVLDRCGLAVFPFGTHHLPSLGWPVVLAQFQYRLRQLAAAAGAAGVLLDPDPVHPPLPVDGRNRRYGQALHLLAALRGAAPEGGDGTRTGLQRIRRSSDQLTEHATSLQLADLAHTLRQRPELTVELGLGPPAAADAVAADLTALLRDREAWQPVPDPVRLPLSAWELRERFPGTVRLLRCYRDVMSRRAYGDYLDAHTAESLVSAVCAARFEGDTGSARSIASLCGEIAALSALFTDDEQVDRAIDLLGEGPRGADPDVFWWDELDWHSWLRAAAAELTRQAEKAEQAERVRARFT